MESASRPLMKALAQTTPYELDALFATLIEPCKDRGERLVVTIKQDAVVHEGADTDCFQRLVDGQPAHRPLESLHDMLGRKRGRTLIAGRKFPVFFDEFDNFES